MAGQRISSTTRCFCLLKWTGPDLNEGDHFITVGEREETQKPSGPGGVSKSAKRSQAAVPCILACELSLLGWKGWVTSKEEWWSRRKGGQSLLTQIDGSCPWNADHNGRSRTRGVSSNSIHPYLCTPEHSEDLKAFGRVPRNAEIRIY